MSDEVADAIANGREYIEKNGWWRGSLMGPNGRQVCALGGLLLGNGYETKEKVFDSDLIMRAAVSRLAEMIDETWVSHVHLNTAVYTSTVASWNDSKSRCKDKQTLLDTLAKAEKIERAGYDPDA